MLRFQFHIGSIESHPENNKKFPLWAAKVRKILIVKELDSRRVEMQKNHAAADDFLTSGYVAALYVAALLCCCGAECDVLWSDCQGLRLQKGVGGGAFLAHHALFPAFGIVDAVEQNTVGRAIDDLR